MNKNNFIAIIFILLLPMSLFSQMKISGQIENQNGKLIEFLEVQLKDKDSLAIKSELTNSEGKFTIITGKGEYLLLVKQLGTVIHEQKIDVNQDYNLGVIKIIQTQQLNEVVVASNKKLLERKVDRLVFNVENSISATGGDAIDALTITPGVKVQGDNIGIVGKAGVDVMINNKKTQLSGNDLITYLKTIRGENISKIEVITNPSVKYDSEGNSGLINIVLKKNTSMGVNGSLQSSINKGYYYNFNNGLNINYQDDKFKISWKGNLANIKSKSLEYNKVESQSQSIENNTNRNFYGNTMSSYMSIDYTLNPKSNFGLVYNISRRAIDGRGKTNTLIQNGTSQNINSRTSSDAAGLVNSLNGYYNYNINKEGKKFSIEGNYITNEVDNSINNYSNSASYSDLQNTKNNSFKIGTAQIDFELPNQWCKLETGAKITSTDSRIYTNSLEDNSITVNNLFSLNEKISALYVTANKEINKKWTVDLGLRYEHTQLNIHPESSDKIVSKYDNVFPTVSVLFNQSEETSWSMNYNARISRPKFEDLNPYQFYNNSYSYTTGNPYLKPSISHNVELNFTHKNVNISLYGSRLLNGSGGITSIENDFQVYKMENYYDENSLGFNVNYSRKFFKIWESTIYGDGHFEHATSNVLQNSTFSGWNGLFSTNNSVILNKSKSLIFFANYWQTTKNKTDFRTIQPNSNLSLGFRYSLLDKKLQLSFTVRDAFRQEYKKGVSIVENGTNTYHNYYDARKFIFSMNYKFGSSKVKGNQKNINNDEQNRTIKE
ncbi:TonB-dependent receptor [Flavobacterium amniphilum]|uniref:TonB-dependent receptor domain-containing protein n=1 Tax=Flavobacterium amniphilum TaxID=1834035 RepID=UPI00202A625D|nr:TonB-dependent receptor [Flavobacterium amniphilum]MCL9805748.1 TonB-dependent receptor [Flavobacterium amniphilum]MCL9806335.1 TonB-dependent receptor [Flavobacterium amniphilum]